MSKVFGYTKRGNNSKGWFTSDAYSDKEIELIKDPEGGSEVSMPTAIPSPFARIDLVKTAFKNISKTDELRYAKEKASRSDEKLVSETLDLVEIIFNIHSLKDKIEIIVWDRAKDMVTLKESPNDKHRRFAETLELYLDQDKDAYNFDSLKTLYLIRYDHQIIGCTSPVTLFFPSGNDLSDARINITGNHSTFGNTALPLYERDIELQKYLYLLFESNPQLKSKMKNFNDYLNRNKEILKFKNRELYDELNELTKDAVQERKFNENYSGLDSDYEIAILGVSLRTRKRENIVGSLQQSDFAIKSPKNPESLIPLVLQNNFRKTWRYANDVWDRNTVVPYKVEEKTKEGQIKPVELKNRKPPGLAIQYPYLTVSDFLEPYLIRLIYPVNKNKFFDGNLEIEKGEDSKGYILPLKKQFFDYFNVSDLINSGAGQPKIKLVQTVMNAVKVVLEIPVAKEGEYITFERIYNEAAGSVPKKPDELQNTGAIVEHQVGLTLFPFLKLGEDMGINPFYRIQLIDRDAYGEFKNNQYNLTFYSDESSAPVEIHGGNAITRRIKTDNGEASSIYYPLEKDFDFIQINSGVASGLILPKWKPYYPGQQEFSFAVDFGTTNTHIEYKVGNIIKPFDITLDSPQIATLFDPDKTDKIGAFSAIAIEELIEHEFVPNVIGTGSYKFPQRTVLSESHNLDINEQTFSLANFNIPFTYEKKVIEHAPNIIETDLKWARRDDGNEKRIRAFFEEILMLLRNKVLLERGNLSKTNFIWFYPSSMSNGRAGTLRRLWDELFQKYFNNDEKTNGIIEALAPFFYFKGEQRLSGGGAYKPVAAIDIGGGTTDIVVFHKDSPVLLTSFKFAANAIFGDGFSDSGNKSNGLVNKYFPQYETLLEKNKLGELKGVLDSIKLRKRSADINAFFFSIEDNPKIVERHLFSYNEKLAGDEDLKIIFLYFYAAILYHIAVLMKEQELEMPKNLVFSGTGSKILKIVSPDLNMLGEFSLKIFEGVYGKTSESRLLIITEESTPKEVTCKGGLMSKPEELEQIRSNNIKKILSCIKDTKTKTAETGEAKTENAETDSAESQTLRYVDLNDDVIKEIAKFVRDFNKFFIGLDSKFGFTENFNVSKRSLNIFKEHFNEDIDGYLETGVKFSKTLDDVTDETEKIGETLFFYPIIGTINNLTGILADL